MHSLCLLLTSCLAGADPGFASTIPEPSGAVPVGYCCPHYNPPISVVYPYNLMPVAHWGSGCLCASGNCGSGGCAPANDCCEPKKCCFCRLKEWCHQRRCCKAKDDCDPCKKHSFFGHHHKKNDCCEPKCCEKPKQDCCKPSLCDRLRACFHHKKKNDCCDSCGSAAAPPAKGPEPIKMPKEEKKEGALDLLPGREAPLPKGPPVATPTSNPIPF